jgi:hypothetical protein
MAASLNPAPLRKRIISYPTPDVTDRVVKELHNATQANYEVPPYGTPHPTPGLYPDHVLAYVTPADDTGFASWFYVNERANQDAYNYVADYPYGVTDFPRYTRTYVLVQDGLVEPALGTPDSMFPGFVLVDHRNVALGDQVLEALFVGVQRFYEKLPGPWVPFTRYDDDLGPVQGRRRAVVNTGQVATLTATGKVSYEAREGSAYVSWEVEESWSNGSGGAGNPGYPLGVRDYYDDDLGPVQEVTQLVVATGSEVGSASSTHNTSFNPYNEFLLKRVHKTWSMPGPVATRDFYDEERGAVQETRQVIAATGSETGSVTGGGVHTSTVFEPVNTYLLRRVVQTFALPGPALVSQSVMDDGAVATITKTLKSPGSITEGETLSGSVMRRVESQVIDAVLAREVVTERPVPGVELTTKTAMDGAFGTVGTEVRRLQPKTVALPEESHLVLGAKLTQVSQETAELVVRSVTAQPVVYDFETEEETRKLIMTSHQVVATVTPTNAALPAVGTEVRYKALTEKRTMKSVTVFNPNTSGGFGGVPSNRVEYIEVTYDYPSLLTSLSFASLEAFDGEFRIGYNANVRAGFRRKVKGTVTISYHTSEPALDEATVIEPVNINAKGLFYSVNVPNVICNAFTPWQFNTGTNNPKWPYYVETIPIPVSTPTLSGYNALTDIVVGCKVQLWKFGLWRKETIRIPVL